ncbi:hypothetical protein RIF29_06734 [Crotalaria pallida]|uniref:Uncharacterized protein n=1 Tax=Crotalaria pallida TaxID=3830 RepID=A0AAN9J3H5_CROPI
MYIYGIGDLVLSVTLTQPQHPLSPRLTTHTYTHTLSSLLSLSLSLSLSFIHSFIFSLLLQLQLLPPSFSAPGFLLAIRNHG